jgi:hypothetical protein
MENANITIRCEAGYGYIGFVASISTDSYEYHQRTTLRGFTSERLLIATDVRADSVIRQMERSEG